jgi:hypothetical protein
VPIIKKIEMTRIFIILLLALTGCSAGQEIIMPFRNIDYSADRLLPLESSFSDFAFRVWINNGTSVDRIISISKDSQFGTQSYIFEIGVLKKKGLFKTKAQSLFNCSEIKPKSGFDSFFSKLDSLNLLEYKSQTDFAFRLSHEPVSLYVVEIKNNGRYNQFSFRTYYPDNEIKSLEYEIINRLILEEFEFEDYMNEK